MSKTECITLLSVILLPVEDGAKPQLYFCRHVSNSDTYRKIVSNKTLS